MTYHKISAHAHDFTLDLERFASTLSLSFNPEQIHKLLGYLDNLLLWTKAYNLTAITNPKEAFVKHILDCLAIVADLPFFDKSNIGVLDVGTGAGLPAVIIAIMKPDWQISALDSNGKKVRFIRQMASELTLPNLVPVASRIEEFEGSFEVITSRAFASLTDFVSLSDPYLKTGGVLYAMKGKTPTDEELAELRGWHASVKQIFVPTLSDERCVVYLERTQSGMTLLHG